MLPNQKTLFFLTPEAPHNPQTRNLHENYKVCNEYKGFGIEIARIQFYKPLASKLHPAGALPW